MHAMAEKEPVVIPRPKGIEIHPALGQFTIDPGDPRCQPIKLFRALLKEAILDQRSLTPAIEKTLFFDRKPTEARTFQVGLLSFPHDDYGSSLRKRADAFLREHGYRFGGIGGYFGFAFACAHVSCPGTVLALGRDLSRNKDILLGLSNCSHENRWTRKIIALRLSRLAGLAVRDVRPTPIHVIIVKDIDIS